MIFVPKFVFAVNKLFTCYLFNYSLLNHYLFFKLEIGCMLHHLFFFLIDTMNNK